MLTTLSEASFWGEALVRWPSDVVARLPVSDEDAAYLRDIGLPVGVDWHLRIAPLPSLHDGLAVLALESDTVPICMSPSRDVIAAEPDNRRMVNSSVRAFGRFLMIYQYYRVRVRDLDEDAAMPLIDAVEQAMNEVDPAAMQSPDSYWPTVVEQMRDGML